MPFVQAGDLDVYYHEAGSGAPVVLVHGNWATSSWWEPVLARLPAAGGGALRGLAYDLRGRGRTTGPDSDYTMPAMAADLRAFCDALGLDAVHLVGHSLGSAVAMQFMLESPERVRSLLAVAPAWVDGMPAAYNVPASQEALAADPALRARSLRALAPTAPDDAYWARLVAESRSQRLTAALRNLPALVAWQPGDRLRAAGVRALVVSGDRDPLTGGAPAVRAAAALGARHVVLPGVGHSPPIEAPDAFVALLVDHLLSEGP